MATMQESAVSPFSSPRIAERLALSVQGKTREQIALYASVSSESVRRYLLGHPPSAAFLGAVCHHEGINGDWMLCGQGPARKKDLLRHHLRQASLSELLGEVGRRLDVSRLGGEEEAQVPSVIGASLKRTA